MNKIRIKASDIRRAIERGAKYSDDWQAGRLEVLRLPKIAKRWKQLNPRFPGVKIRFHKGRPHKGYTPDDNRAVTDWSQFAGYEFNYGIEGYGWNCVRSEWYSHGPGCAWNGVGRETISQFIDSLCFIVAGYDHPEHRKRLVEAKIDLTS